MSSSPHLVIVSGLSGAGKSTALNALEDMGYNCIDNLPASLLHDFGRQMNADPDLYRKVALGLDARAPGLDMKRIRRWLEDLQASGIRCQMLFLGADDESLFKRFAETRRRHPLATETGSLKAAIARERQIMDPVRETADWEIDTSRLNIHQLTHQTWKCVGPDADGMTVVLQSFGFSKGTPKDADFQFDVRSLPNPHWEPELRGLTGRDSAIIEFLEKEPLVIEMAQSIGTFLSRWLPELDSSHRSFVTVAIGCTGGRHRSVYLVERLARELAGELTDIVVNHRELEP